MGRLICAHEDRCEEGRTDEEGEKRADTRTQRTPLVACTGLSLLQSACTGQCFTVYASARKITIPTDTYYLTIHYLFLEKLL